MTAGGSILKDIITGSTCILSAAILIGFGYLKFKGPFIDLIYLAIIFLFIANGLFLLYKGYDE